MKLADAVREYNAGTLADQPDASLYALQAKLDNAVVSHKAWAEEVRSTLQDDPEVSAQDYLKTTEDMVMTLDQISQFITKTVNTRYGCQD